MTEHPYADTLKKAQEAIDSAAIRLKSVDGPQGVVTFDSDQFNSLIQAVDALRKMVREQYLRDYAETLLLESAQVEFLTIGEAAEEFLVGDTEITEEEMRFVADFLGDATVTVRLPPLPVGVDK